MFNGELESEMSLEGHKKDLDVLKEHTGRV